ncbi:cytosine permease [Nesterenkonia sp. NBAIMH1]|uniref:purine-cytosine permease family protein n=1 Tax=Nesterenkonia sp. NBAIMH1 TaxID=2600320 RepID=UPI0011B40576|nr:cytosine permease [Nesterenkonia sp. NBAIMH1]
MSAKASSTETDRLLSEEHRFGTFPLLKKERVWSFADFTWVNTSLAIATWAFIVGGSTALMVGFRDGVLAMIIGNAIGLSFMVLAATAASQRYGSEQYTMLRGAFGVVGVGVLVFTIVLITEMGWSSLLAVMAGRAASQITGEVTGAELSQYGPLVTVGALVAIGLAWFILSRGPITIGRLNAIVAPGLALIVAGMMIFLVMNTSWDALNSAAPIAPFEDDTLNFMIAVEFNIGVGVSWFPIMGSLARMAKSRRAALWPSFLGLFLATVLAQTVGLAAALTLGESDPTVWMVPFGGPLLGIGILAFIAFANITSMSSIVYSTVLAIRQSSGQALAKVPWKGLSALFFILPAIMTFFPQFMYEQFMLFVTYSGAFLTAVCGVALADYFILRRQRMNLRELHLGQQGTLYAYKGGVNIAGLASVAVGAVLYVFLYDPVSLETNAAFSYVTASIPTVLIAAISYLVLSKVLYGRRTSKEAAPKVSAS